MFTFETSIKKKVRRFDAHSTAEPQPLGRASAVTGHVRSIVENKSSVPAAWVITIIPEEPKPVIATRPAPTLRSFARETSARKPAPAVRPTCSAGLALSRIQPAFVNLQHHDAFTAGRRFRLHSEADGIIRLAATTPCGRIPRCCGRRACASLRRDGSRTSSG